MKTKQTIVPRVQLTKSGKQSYTVKEIQSFLGISRPTAYKLVKSELFRTVKVGRQIRIPAKAFEEWLEGVQ